jgi:hypothetical protein
MAVFTKNFIVPTVLASFSAFNELDSALVAEISNLIRGVTLRAIHFYLALLTI